MPDRFAWSGCRFATVDPDLGRVLPISRTGVPGSCRLRQPDRDRWFRVEPTAVSWQQTRSEQKHRDRPGRVRCFYVVEWNQRERSGVSLPMGPCNVRYAITTRRTLPRGEGIPRYARTTLADKPSTNDPPRPDRRCDRLRCHTDARPRRHGWGCSFTHGITRNRRLRPGAGSVPRHVGSRFRRAHATGFGRDGGTRLSVLVRQPASPDSPACWWGVRRNH